jgi:limonene-1,2-epoxide hydrolase
MGHGENAQLVERIWRTLSDQDFSLLEASLADDAVQEWPQSRERVHGKANIIAVYENYPGFPTVRVCRTSGTNGLVVSEVELNYSGTVYHVVSIFEFVDGKISCERDYFAEPFEAPGWRARWVERM